MLKKFVVPKKTCKFAESIDILLEIYFFSTNFINNFMKHLRLFVALFALLGVLSANAQEEITNEYLQNADLKSLTGWTQVGYTDWKTDGAVPVIEFWNWSNEFSFTQTITLPAGDYRLAVNSFYRESWSGNGTNNNMAWIFAGEKKQNVIALNNMNELSQYAGSNDLYHAATAFSQGKYSNEFDFTVEAANTPIEIGFKGTTPNGGWCILGPVKLYKYSLENYLADLQTKANEAIEVINGLNLPTPVKENFISQINEKKNATYSLSSEVTQAIADINTIKEQAVSLEATRSPALAAYEAAKASVQEVLAVFPIEGAEATISEQDAIVSEATTVEAIQAATNQVNGILTPYLYDATSSINNPNPVNNVDGWDVTIAPNAFDPGNDCAEFWNRKGARMTQNVNLPAGVYRLTVIALTRTDYNSTIEANGITKQIAQVGSGIVNSRGQANTWFNAGNGVNTIVFKIDETKDVTIGLNVEPEQGDGWTVFRSFKLETIANADPTLALLQADLQAAVAAAEALEGTVPASVYQALTAVVAENNKEYETADEYTAAINAIKEATEAAKPLQAAYGRYLDVKAAVLAVNANVDTTDPDTQANAATSAEEIEAAVAAVRQALLAILPEMEVPEEGIELTNAIIDNPTVSVNTDYWTKDGTPNGGYSFGVTNYGETEFYNCNFDFYQNLTLGMGTYEFGVTGFHRAGTYDTYFYAGEDKILVPGVSNTVVNSMAEAQQWFDQGNGKVALKFALEEETNNIKIGIVNNDTQTDKWTIFRNFTLKYFGSQVDLSIYQDEWEAAVAAANAAIAANPNVTGEELAAVQNAIADAPEQTKASYIEKTNALLAATQTFTAAAPDYNAYAAEKAIAEMIGVEVGEAPANAAAAAAGVNALKVAEFDFVKENYTYDYEPVIGTFGEWEGTATVGGQPGEPNYLDYEHWSGQTHAYYEQDKTGYNNSNGWTIQYTKTAKLPAGDYMLKVAARSSEGTTSLVSCSATENTVTLPNKGNSGRGIATNGNASFSDEDTFIPSTAGVENAGCGWEWRFLPFTLTETTEVTMTFYAEATTQGQWMSISDGTLLSKQEIQNIVEISGNDQGAPEAQVASQVITDRKLLAGLNTVIFPFETTAEELSATTVLEYTGTTVEEDGLTFNFQKVAPVDGVVTLQANVPYAVFVDADTEDLTFGSKNINPGNGWYNECVTEDPNNQFDFRGTYSEVKKGNDSFINNKDYVAGATKFNKAKGGNGLKAYRAYLQFVGTDEPAKVAFNFDGAVVDGIEAVELLNNLNGNIYNLNGQKLQKAQKGINIVNGKKVLVK